MNHQSKIYDYSKEELQRLYDESNTFHDLSKKLNIKSYKTIREAFEEKGIDYSKLQSIIYIKYDLTGQTFGYLKVIGLDEQKSGKDGIYWKCKCKCGKETSVCTYNLRSNHTTSCGCKRIENVRKARKKYNDYDLSGEYGIGYARNTNAQFYFDKEDYNKIKDYCWNQNNSQYITTNIKHKNTMFHRLIMSCENNTVEIDHINHNVVDNRKENLRICDRSENARNRGLQSNNTSGCAGVGFVNNIKKWRARIKIYGKEIHLGYFEKYEDAVKARKEAEIKYYGEFRYKEELVNDKL